VTEAQRSLAGSRLGTSVLVVLFCVTAVHEARSHHSVYGQYSGGKPLNVTGVVRRVEWINPHAFVHVGVTVNGAEVVYLIELQGLTALTGKGWNGGELAIGETVKVVDAYLEAGEGSTQACCANIYDPSGREFYTGTARAEALKEPVRRDP
jgi:hypothetical protein